MQALIGFLATTPGRGVRVVAGIALVLIGLLAVGGVAGVIIAIIGAVPLAAGALDVCVFAPLFGLPFGGNDLRHATHMR
jgi:Inner membrane protein YgaP-like, transmembrane domain